jgi:hypothetical protein
MNEALTVGPRLLFHHLPLPPHRCGVIGVDWLGGLPMTASGFDRAQARVRVGHLPHLPVEGGRWERREKERWA